MSNVPTVPSVDPANVATVRIDYDDATGQATFVVVSDPPPPWLSVTQRKDESWLFTVSTLKEVGIDFVPGENLVAITGLSFTAAPPTSSGLYAAGGWLPAGDGMLLVDDGGTEGSWEFQIGGQGAADATWVFDPKIYNEGTPG